MGERLRCPSHLEGRLATVMEDRRFREGRFLGVMGLVFGVLSLAVDALIVPEKILEIAILRLFPTVPLQLIAILMPRERLAWQQVALGASLCAFAVSLVISSQFVPYGPSTAIVLGPVILLGIAVPLLPFSKTALSIFLVAFVVPVAAATMSVGLSPDFTRTLLIVLVIVAGGSALIGLRLRRLERQGALATLIAEERAQELEVSNTRLTQLSMQDPLTSLANRRWTEAAFARDYALSRDEAPGQTAVLLLDLDHFKEFNDRWGHDVGDRALKAVAEVIRHKASDHCGLAARIGGEEFVILVRAFDVAEAMNLAEEIRLGIERIEIRIDSVRDSVTCSASIGVAVHEGHDAPELKILLKRADDALYEAKRDGRNRFKLAA